jgi:hypothetical protein
MRPLLTFGLVMSIVGTYLGSYFALVQRGWGDANLGWVAWYPTYRFSGPWPCDLVGTIYESAHQLDRRFLRRKVWLEKQDLMALFAAELPQSGQAAATKSVGPNHHLQTTPR